MRASGELSGDAKGQHARGSLYGWLRDAARTSPRPPVRSVGSWCFGIPTTTAPEAPAHDPPAREPFAGPPGHRTRALATAHDELARATERQARLNRRAVAAGVTTQAIERAAGGRLRVVRARPNTPALVGAGAAAICAGAAAGEEDLAWAEEILGAVGVVVRVAEKDLDAVTGLSGSGPAYVFLVAEAMAEAGVLDGLSRDVAETLAFQTLLGSAQLLVDRGASPAALRAAVTGPAGTTAAGLRELERHGVRAAFLDAVTAAAHRSRELGG
jgi:pyrroline-5-carboxylate reductase